VSSAGRDPRRQELPPARAAAGAPREDGAGAPEPACALRDEQRGLPRRRRVPPLRRRALLLPVDGGPAPALGVLPRLARRLRPRSHGGEGLPRHDGEVAGGARRFVGRLGAGPVMRGASLALAIALGAACVASPAAAEPTPALPIPDRDQAAESPPE